MPAFLHELVPELDRVVAIDVGDLLFLDDIKNLWAEFQNFNEHQVFGASLEVGPTQVSYSHDASQDVAAFWAKRGLPEAGKGLNSGVLLLDLKRMRKVLIGGVSWTGSLLKAAHRMNRFYCGHEGMAEQALFSAFVFSGGEAYWKELPSTWNYIPSIPWEVDSNNFRSNKPKQVLQRKLHPGLLSGGCLEHACPSYAHLLGEWTWAQPEDVATWFVQKAKSYYYWFHSLHAPGFYSENLTCGAKVFVVHFAGYTKLLPWARKLLRYWADGPDPAGFYDDELG